MFTAINKKKQKVAIENSTSNDEYFCPLCNSKLIRKQGSINAHHFAHKKETGCDPWYKDMSEW